MARAILAASILNKTRKRDPWFLDDYTLNPYSGCSFNCLYCYTRGSRYGVNMAEKLRIKSNAVQLLEQALALRARKKQYGIIVLSSATDPYLQAEQGEQLTRQLLEVILHYRFPVHVLTKSDLVARDFDLLRAIDKAAILPEDLRHKLEHRAFLTFSFSTLDENIARIFEPGATPPSARLATLKLAREAGLYCGVSLMPMLPFITDTGPQLDDMFRRFQAAKAAYIFPATLTLSGEGISDSKTLVHRAVAKHYPQLLEKYQAFFAEGAQMPLYYRRAFASKTAALSRQYRLPNSLMKNDRLE